MDDEITNRAQDYKAKGDINHLITITPNENAIANEMPTIENHTDGNGSIKRNLKRGIQKNLFAKTN